MLEEATRCTAALDRVAQACHTPLPSPLARRERLEIGLNSWRFQQQLGLAKEGAVDWDAEGGMGKKEAKGKTQVGLNLHPLVPVRPAASIAS